MTRPLRVLVACEFSGRVRDAFIAQGHSAISCDLLPTDTPGPHYQGDVFDLITASEIEGGPFDMMIAHPPCTYLTNAGVRWLYEKDHRGDRTHNAQRWADMQRAAKFFRRLLESDIPMIAVENPIMHSYARELVGRRPDQTIHPWMFGHPESKSTCLWLKNMPLLTETHNVKAEMEALPYAESHKIHVASPGPDRWKLRSLTYQGIADAMAQQWGTFGVQMLRHSESLTPDLAAYLRENPEALKLA